MGIERGFNKPHNEGVYVCRNDFLWEFKVFHENLKEPSHLIAREFNSNEKLGPIVLETGTQEEVEKVLESSSDQLISKLANR